MMLQRTEATAGGAIQNSFSPYDWNGGSVVGVAGDDFVVLAADRRLATGSVLLANGLVRTNSHLSTDTISKPEISKGFTS